MNKPKIILKPNFHREMNVVQVIFPYNEVINIQLRNFKALRYSATMKSWYFPEANFTLEKFVNVLKPIANIDYSKLDIPEPVEHDRRKTIRKVSVARLNELQEAAIKKTREHLVLKNYSKSTVKVYLSLLREYFVYHSNKNPLDITEEDIKDYLLYQLEERCVAISTQNQVINAIKFYYEKVEKLERKTYYVERPMKPFQLPKVLSFQEVQLILESTGNLKHEAILATLYAGGLRIGELINLHITDIMRDHRRILIRGGKGRKDRLTLLSDKLLNLLREYVREYRPQSWLFEGSQPGSQYSDTSVRAILKNAAKKAGIRKNVNPHMLRHSFATHMMERGTDIRLIQNLLGHGSLKTTEIYTHISGDAIDRLKSPFDYDD